MKRVITFGALADSLAKQLPELTRSEARAFQKDADAIDRLRIRGLITRTQSHAASKRLLQAILKEIA